MKELQRNIYNNNSDDNEDWIKKKEKQTNTQIKEQETNVKN